MREIKFRAWDKKYKKMNFLGENTSFNAPREDFELMQFTGLKDSSGKEIYEGDLMMWMSQDTDDSIMQGLYEIVFKDGSFMAKHCKGLSPLYEDLRNFLVIRDDELLEVIGNIYEHPHLLEDKA